MKTSKLCLFSMVVICGMLLGCAGGKTQSPDVAGNIRQSLSQAGFKDVSVSQDRDKGLVTLGGHVPVEEDKMQAESIAKAIASGQVVANEIAVTPKGGESDAKAVDAALDAGIEKNLDAALIQHKMQKMVKYEVKNGVVTLTGEVPSQAARDQVANILSSVPNVQQVVNDLQVKNQKVTTSKK